jgi:hypothetical protein
MKDFLMNKFKQDRVEALAQTGVKPKEAYDIAQSEWRENVRQRQREFDKINARKMELNLGSKGDGQSTTEQDRPASENNESTPGEEQPT